MTGTEPNALLLVLGSVETVELSGSLDTQLVADCGHNCWVSPMAKEKIQHPPPMVDQVITACTECALENHTEALQDISLIDGGIGYLQEVLIGQFGNTLHEGITRRIHE